MTRTDIKQAIENISKYVIVKEEGGSKVVEFTDRLPVFCGLTLTYSGGEYELAVVPRRYVIESDDKVMSEYDYCIVNKNNGRIVILDEIIDINGHNIQEIGESYIKLFYHVVAEIIKQKEM